PVDTGDALEGELHAQLARARLRLRQRGLQHAVAAAVARPTGEAKRAQRAQFVETAARRDVARDDLVGLGRGVRLSAALGLRRALGRLRLLRELPLLRRDACREGRAQREEMQRFPP